MRGTCYGVILQNGETEQEAREFISAVDFSEIELEEENIKYAQYIDTIEGIELWYDYGADYYFFRPSN